MLRGENLTVGQRVYVSLHEGGRVKASGVVDFVRRTRRAGVIVHVRTVKGIDEYPACWVWPDEGERS